MNDYRSFGNSVEFMFGIVLFFNGVYILFFEAGGFVRAILMCVHAYFNLYCEARAGWSAFMKRRQAVDKINSLPEASEKQIQELADVCAICYQEMESARITRCNHYFHGICLRKWLYVQDKCPICHEIMYKKSTPAEGEASDEAQIDAQANRLNVQGLFGWLSAYCWKISVHLQGATIGWLKLIWLIRFGRWFGLRIWRRFCFDAIRKYQYWIVHFDCMYTSDFYGIIGFCVLRFLNDSMYTSQSINLSQFLDAKTIVRFDL